MLAYSYISVETEEHFSRNWYRIIVCTVYIILRFANEPQSHHSNSFRVSRVKLLVGYSKHFCTVLAKSQLIGYTGTKLFQYTQSRSIDVLVHHYTPIDTTWRIFPTEPFPDTFNCRRPSSLEAYSYVFTSMTTRQVFSTEFRGSMSCELRICSITAEFTHTTFLFG